MAQVFSDTQCEHGEGPLWHPLENALYWFDIQAKRLYRRDGERERFWQFDEQVSAAGWVDIGVLLVASETSLFEFETSTGESTFLCPLEPDNEVTRSNDGRADPWGGFWIGTMGKNAETKAGAIYRYVGGELHMLFDKITITNAICFAPDRSSAYFADSITHRIFRVGLDADGFPRGNPELFVDLRDEGLVPDGAVVDADGNLWNAQWGASRVTCYSPDGTFLRAIPVGGQNSSCPAFGGADLTTLFVTTSQEGLIDPAPAEGRTYMIEGVAKGQQEHRVIL